MTTLTVRGLTADLHAQLRVRAARNGRSMAAEVRAILEDQLGAPEPATAAGPGWGGRVHARFAGIDADDTDLTRSPDRPRPADLHLGE